VIDYISNPKSQPNVSGKWLGFLLHIWEVADSNLNLGNDFLTEVLITSICFSPQTPRQYLELDQERTARMLTRKQILLHIPQYLAHLACRSSSPGRVKNFLFSVSSTPALGPTQPPIQRAPEVKRQGRETDHSAPTSADVKKTWFNTSTPRMSSWRSA
jgi:hypothetical protein